MYACIYGTSNIFFTSHNDAVQLLISEDNFFNADAPENTVCWSYVG